MQNKSTAFTLVELIVVITILAILGTIAFISLQGYSAESRDSKRISDLGQIRTGLQIKQARESTVPMPSEAISIGSGTTIYTYQGYAGTGVLNSLRVSDNAKDPVENNYYTYTTNSNRTRFQLMAMLENGDTVSKNNLITQTYADYASRYSYTIGDPLGTLLKTTTKIPVQELGEDINLLTDTEEYIPVFTRKNSTTSSSGSELVTRIIESSNNTGGTNESPTSEYVGGTAYSKGETFSYDGLNWYVSGNPNVAYTRTSGPNDIPTDLTALDNILVFDNGTGSLLEGTTAFVIRTVNEGATEPYIYGTSYGSGHLWNEGTTYSDGETAYKNDNEMLGDYFQWGRNDPVSLLSTTTGTLYDGGGYMTGGVDLTGSGFIINGTSPSSWITESKHNETISVTWTNNEKSGVCPTDYHLPSTSTTMGEGEWRIVTELVTGVTSSWSTSDRQKLQKYLLLPMGGYRNYLYGDYNSLGSIGDYWSSSVTGDNGHRLLLHSSGINPSTSSVRTFGFSVRCFKN